MQMTQTFTQEHKAKLEEYLATHTLPQGLGSEESACSIAAINLAMTGALTDYIPDCMSNVLGRATMDLQDAMPKAMRNSERYKALLPNMAGTGREHEYERLDILLDWMWTVVLPQLQPIADKNGFSTEWETMRKLKTADAADTAAYAAISAGAYAAARAAADAADAAISAGAYAGVRAAALVAAAYAAGAAISAGAYAAAAALVAARAAARAVTYAAQAADSNFWKTVDPIGVLERMTYLNAETNK